MHPSEQLVVHRWKAVIPTVVLGKPFKSSDTKKSMNICMRLRVDCLA